MNPSDLIHWLVTGLFGIVLGLVGWIFTTAKGDHDRKIAALETQNAAQERELATLRANQDAHGEGYDRLSRAIERMDSKIDQLMVALGRRATPFSTGSGQSGSER